MLLEVTAIKARSSGVKSFELRSVQGGPLPRFAPGAHVRITIPELASGDNTRAYSLVSDPLDLDRYEVAVLHVQPGNGGSAWMHASLQPGDVLEVSEPRNDFRLEASDTHSTLIAGGIGITPILSLVREIVRLGSSFEVHYVGRGADRMPYIPELLAMAGGNVRLYFGRRELNLSSVIQPGRRDAHYYVCGPHALIESVRHEVAQAGISASQLHFEAFGYRRQTEDREAEVELRASGLTLPLKPGRPLLEAIEMAGGWIPADCRKGECGTCISNIVEGEVDHRDHCLSPEQRKSMMCPCVSWPVTDKLILDI